MRQIVIAVVGGVVVDAGTAVFVLVGVAGAGLMMVGVLVLAVAVAAFVRL